MTTEVLNKLDTFATLEPQEMELVRNLMEVIHVKNGEILFHEGDKGDRMYIVQEGEVSISISVGAGEEMEVSRIKEGSFFGEVSIIEQDIRSATCRAIKECILLSLDGTSFSTLIENQPKIAIKIMARMLNTAAIRLRNTGTFLSDMVRWGEDARLRALTDEMTKLYNRRFFDEALEITFSDAISLNRSMSLVMLDIDKFGTLNKEYGEKVGDDIIYAVVDIFREIFDEEDILIRYGGDEFSFILPEKNGEMALTYCNRVVASVRKIDILNNLEGSFNNPSVSIGIATYPDHGNSVSELIANADKALYASKEAGRNQASLFKSTVKPQVITQEEITTPISFHDDGIMENIIQALTNRDQFLILGHVHIDGDCLFSMSAIAFTLGNMNKKVTILLNNELLNRIPEIKAICARHSVRIEVSLHKVNTEKHTLIICDTAKPSMLENEKLTRSIIQRDNNLVIEIDHHIQSAREKISHREYSLIRPVTSTCEIVFSVLNRMQDEKSVIKRLNGKRLFSIDILESLIAGIDSDTKKGKLFKTQDEKTHFELLFHLLNTLPEDESSQEPSIQHIAKILDAPSEEKNHCIDVFLQHKHSIDGISWVALDEATSKRLWENYESETIVNVARHISDVMAQESGCLGFVAYYEAVSNLIQLRMRRDYRYKGIDLRKIIEHFNINDGGGHEGAIGFRIPKDQVNDFTAFVDSIIKGTLELIHK